MRGAGERGGKNKMQKTNKKRKIFSKTVHVNITLSLSPKPERENTKLHTGLQYEPLHRATVSYQCRRGNNSNNINNNRSYTDHHKMIS